MSRQFNGKMQHFTNAKCKYSSIGRALDFHSKGCEFEPRYLLKFINRMNKRTLAQIPIEEIKQLASQVNSYSKLIVGLGCTKNGGNQQTIKKIVEENTYREEQIEIENLNGSRYYLQDDKLYTIRGDKVTIEGDDIDRVVDLNSPKTPIYFGYFFTLSCIGVAMIYFVNLKF